MLTELCALTHVIKVDTRTEGSHRVPNTGVYQGAQYHQDTVCSLGQDPQLIPWNGSSSLDTALCHIRS